MTPTRKTTLNLKNDIDSKTISTEYNILLKNKTNWGKKDSNKYTLLTTLNEILREKK